MGNKSDLTGKVFGKLTVLKEAARRNGRIVWLCLCECGNKSIIQTSNLTNGHTKSCQCLRRSKNGSSQLDVYNIWKGMIARCHKPQNEAYEDYGGRGIVVCKRWHNIANFIADMKERPSSQHTIDRIDNNKGYSPNNCRWATRVEQGRNKRNNKIIKINGVEKCLSEWVEQYKTQHSMVYARIFRRGWDPVKALTEPSQRQKH